MLIFCCPMVSELEKGSKVVDCPTHQAWRPLITPVDNHKSSPRYFKYVNDPRFNLYSYSVCTNL